MLCLNGSSRGAPAFALFAWALCFLINGPADASGNYRDRNKACATNLQSCPIRGCADEGSDEALVNEIKKTVPPHGTAIRLTFEDFAELQDIAEQLVDEGKAISVENRLLLQNLTLSSGTRVSEGDLVELRGFVVKDSPRPKPAGPESVNCRLTKSSNNDIHIPIVEEHDHQEFGAVVVEMIPQARPKSWTSTALKRASDQNRPVVIRGQLFYDNNHKANGDAENDNGQPKRFSLWEIHPVTEFWVCFRADRNCGGTLAKPKDWKKLDQLPK